MKQYLFFLLLSFYSFQTLAQKSYDLEKMYVTTLENYFNSNQRNEIEIVADTLFNFLPEIIKGNHFSYYSNSNQASLGKKKGEFDLYWINHKIINQDTIDINIGEWAVTIKKGLFIRHGNISFKETELAAICGGTMGYIPTQRFILIDGDILTFTSADLIESKMNERKKRIQDLENKK